MYYAQGPWSATSAAEQQNNSLLGGLDTRQRSYALGAGYDFGVVKMVGAYRQTNNQPQGMADYKDKTYTLGASRTRGRRRRGERLRTTATSTTTWPAWMRKRPTSSRLGYEHNLSKRTALYGTYSYLKNKDGGTMSLVADLGATLSDSGKQHAVQVGLRHSF